MRGVLFLPFLFMPLACSGQTAPDAAGDASINRPDSNVGLLTDAGMCGVTTTRVEPNPAVHVDQGSTLMFASNPPCGGNHYPIWATWGIHDTVVPRGNWIHNLEHGGVVFLYRCASRTACPDVAAKLEAFVKTLPQDPVCASELPALKNRAVVTPDPDLPAGVQVAAVAWGHSLVARCVDEAALRDFYLAHFGRATENFCSEGSALVPGDASVDDTPVIPPIADAKAMKD